MRFSLPKSTGWTLAREMLVTIAGTYLYGWLVAQIWNELAHKMFALPKATFIQGLAAVIVVVLTKRAKDYLK